MGRDDAVAVCDPVFLLSKEEWEEMVPNLGLDSKNYVLVYDFDNNPIIEQIAKSIAKAKGLDIYNVGAFRKSYAKKNFIYIGPIKFLSLIKKASYVVSNSFHATAFSVIFRKQFCVVKRNEDINERMVSLLVDLGLEKRIVSDYGDVLFDKINYDNVIHAICKSIDVSETYLKSALER